MGICDLIPGVSGGTVAYASGIYDDFLAAIQSLNLTNWKKIHWRFISKLIAGVATSVLLFSKLFYFLLLHHKLLLFAFFFGAIIASSSLSLKKPSWMCALGFLISFIICSFPEVEVLKVSAIWLFVCGMLGSAAMLLPGISGSFVLHILGVYTLFIQALSRLDFKFLIIISLGIAAGFLIFSRLISRLLAKHPQKVHGFMIGCMLGGLRSLWPYTAHNILSASLFVILGFLLTFLLERKAPLLVK